MSANSLCDALFLAKESFWNVSIVVVELFWIVCSVAHFLSSIIGFLIKLFLDAF